MELFIKCDRLVDGTGAPVSGPVIVSSRDGRIEKVERESPPDVYDRDATVHEYPGCTILPGLVDAHNHPSLTWELKDYLLRMADAPEFLLLRALRNLPFDLAAGVTTARCPAERNCVDLLYREALQNGWIQGPRLFTSGPGFRHKDGHGFLGTPVSDGRELREKIRINAEAGVDFIKVFATGTVLVDGEMPSYFTFDELKTAVDEAHKHGLAITVHAAGGQGLKDSVRAGVDSVEHGYFIEDETLELMKGQGQILVLTTGVFFDDELIDHLHSIDMQQAFRSQRTQVFECLAKAVDSGVRLALGTDGLHGRLFSEIKFLTRCGMAPAEAIAVACRGGAEVCGLASQVGTIEPGKRADLVVVKGDPGQNIDSLQDMVAVYRDGERIDPLPHDALAESRLESVESLRQRLSAFEVNE